jgi:hypothetical protein
MVYKALISNVRLNNRSKTFQGLKNGLQSTNQKRQTEQQEQSFSQIKMVYKTLIRKGKFEQQEKRISEINNGLQSINQ